MSTHPYPEHVLDAVEEALRDKLYEGALPVQLAETALQALWDASRVDTPDQLDKLADQAIIHDGYFHYEKDVYAWLGGTGYEYIPSYEMSLPSHVIYWGDSDE